MQRQQKRHVRTGSQHQRFRRDGRRIVRQILGQPKERDPTWVQTSTSDAVEDRWQTMRHAHVLNVFWTSVIGLSDDPTADDDPLSLGNTHHLAGRGPPMAFGRQPGVVHPETRMAGLGVPQRTGIVEFEHGAVLEGGADERVFEVEWEAGLGEGQRDDVRRQRRGLTVCQTGC